MVDVSPQLGGQGCGGVGQARLRGQRGRHGDQHADRRLPPAPSLPQRSWRPRQLCSWESTEQEKLAGGHLQVA